MEQVSSLAITPSKNFFLRDGTPFFWLADTVWSAFTNVTKDEWHEYLKYRRLQGFNVLQINVLHQWDASTPYLRFPFRKDAQGNYSSFELDEDYFAFAEELLEVATDFGFIPALVLLWCNFVPDTWGAKRGISPVMPLKTVEKYLQFVIPRFARFDPIFIISGDTDFGSSKTVEYYLKALEIAKTLLPSSLTALHLQPHAVLPEEIVASQHLDFYMYQSGHGKLEQNLPYVLAKRCLEYSVKRPIVNGEPCYEGHPYGFTKEGRFRTFDVRKAIWQSLLSGASAGVTYGAHGIWCWHREGAEFKGVEFSGEPFEWRIALSFNGAWEASFAKFVFERFELFGLESANDLLVGVPEEIRFGMTSDRKRFALYAPLAQTVAVSFDLREYDVFGVDLEQKRFFTPLLRFEEGSATFLMPPLHSDVLFVGVR